MNTHRYNPTIGLQITKGPHNNPALYYSHTPWWVHKVVSMALQENHMDHPMYKLRERTGAFFQGGHNEWQGFLYIEFWRTDDELGSPLQKFVDALNEHIRYVEQNYLPMCAVHRTITELTRRNQIENFPEFDVEFQGSTLLTPTAHWDYRQTWGENYFNLINAPRPEKWRLSEISKESFEEMLEFLYWTSVPAYGKEVKVVFTGK